ncbi:related to ATP dependent RNA helicase [Phialocephala subalpina]|uniref:Related to ATP dependent RNA helicase n=1 Tax=Phialocephala subalpina TaxID=576137 RepID=A0A1L7WWL2_9HELO|nr:related to ATP dependent RNA helicase [Phialocephala subalpina]
MPRPEIIRADSIDLQDQNSPSAQDHTRQPAHPAPLGSGPPAPHQAEALRELKVEAAEENHRSPRVSKEWSTTEVQQLQQYGDDLAAGVTSKLNGANLQQQQDNLAVAQNGGLTGSTAEDADMADAEGDDGMDDDMMDKISSSPSIDDGGYSLPHLWSQRADSLTLSTPTKSPSQACGDSSSLFVDTPEHFPLGMLPDPIDKDDVQGIHKSKYRHFQGELPDATRSESNYDGDRMDDIPTPASKYQPHPEAYDEDFDLDQLTNELLEAHMNMLEEDDEDVFHTPKSRSEEREPEDELDEPDDLKSDDGIPTIPYEASSDEDDDSETFFPTSPTRIDSGWGGDCLQDIEDIDFEFVYALHTFVATVEGQANATKGDTMVLLDDSNSYWWLVRVVKDSSIGYLPAEHIETPTERLARLNKHRNIDLTSTMLGDQAEKSKNPLKKAIRRRNAKTVTFTAPTYVEASDNDYSTDEEEGEEGYYGQNGQQEQNGDQEEQAVEEEEVATVEPLKPRAEIREVKTEPVEQEKDIISKTSSDATRTSDEIFEGKVESKSRNGTVRNTDSFFKDDSVETRKITLTPNLLRDDSSTSTRTSNDSKELKQRPSLDKLEKDSPEKGKDKKAKDKKDKEKKPGMLSGLFKRKEKKNKSSIDEEIDELIAGKQSTENSRSSPEPSRDSGEMVAAEEQASTQTSEVQRQPSKLQKQPRTDTSPTRKAGQGREVIKPSEPQQAPAPNRATPAESVQAPSMRLVQPETSDEVTQQSSNTSPETSRGPRERAASEASRAPAPILTVPKEQKSVGAISKMLRSNSESKPVKTKKAKSRVELDDFDSSDENSPVEEPIRGPKSQRPIPGSFPDSYIASPPPTERSNHAEERLSESPVQVSPVQLYPPPLMVDTSSQEEPPSPVSSPSPELIDAEDAREKKGGSSTTSTSTPTWSDAHLRTFFDDDADIKDLLVVVYDKSGVVPAGPDHPITGNLFREENAKLADITNRLDGMLGDWLARKMRAQGSTR